MGTLHWSCAGGVLTDRGRLSSALYRLWGKRPECLRILEEDERRRQGDRQGGGRVAGVGIMAIQNYLYVCIVLNPHIRDQSNYKYF